MRQDDLRAFDALAKHPRLADLVTLTRELTAAAAVGRRADWKDAAKLKGRAADLALTSEDAATDFGNALAVLERGPEDDAERSLASALLAHALAENPPKGRDDEDRVASDTLWLATHTPFDATRLLDRALGESAGDLWDAVTDRVRRVDQGQLPTLGRGEALLGCAALAMSSSSVARKHAASLAAEVKDPVFARVLLGRPPATDAAITGEVAPPPRGAFATALLGLTGILFVMHVARLLARSTLAYRRPAEVTLSEESVRIHARTLLLGRTLADRVTVLPRAGLVHATREVRFPRAALYAGLFALAFGSLVGVMMFVDGARSASPSLLAVGIVIVAAGVGLDFALNALWPGTRGKCRIVFVPRRGPAMCVGEVDAARADAALETLKRGPG